MFTESAYLLIECDARIIPGHRDPPGQKCVYIPPGDPCREVYRLSTFRNYPRDTPMDPRDLAANGFYFSGYKDRVKCFSCGRSVDSWRIGDDPYSREWHTQDCQFSNGGNSGNEPIKASSLRFGIALQSDPNRHQSSDRHPTTSHLSSPPSPSQNPIDLDRSSPGVTETISLQRTSPVTEIKSSFRLATNHRDSLNFSTDGRRRNDSDFRHLFPCLYPINPHMRSEEARMQTFIQQLQEWSNCRLNVTPKDIVEAGMFYLGERDRVKCWYCNGGLQNWKMNDIPWEEHAKWFPKCEFVLQSKGPEFVHRIVTRYPNLQRPSITNPANNTSFTFLSSSRPPPSPPASNAVTDPREEEGKIAQQVDDEMKFSPHIAQATLMGFDHTTIRRVLTRRYKKEKRGFANAHDLVESLLASNDHLQQSEGVPTMIKPSVTQNRNSLPPDGARNSHESKPFVGIEMLKQLENSRKCKVCRIRQANIVLIPCGHLVLCSDCSVKTKKCPICHAIIRERMRSYIS